MAQHDQKYIAKVVGQPDWPADKPDGGGALVDRDMQSTLEDRERASQSLVEQFVGKNGNR